MKYNLWKLGINAETILDALFAVLNIANEKKKLLGQNNIKCVPKAAANL